MTLVQGRADKVGGPAHVASTTSPGPSSTRRRARSCEPKGRLDTESVALHPRFVDVDGDGRLDYVADSIRGNTLDLIKRVMGEEPDITFTVFRFDAAAGTFERTPYVTKQRPYCGGEARGNTFGRSGFFEGDFDGDGVKDLLDLGNLTGVAIWKGGREEGAFEEALLKRVAVEKDKTLVADAVVADLNGDGARGRRALVRGRAVPRRLEGGQVRPSALRPRASRARATWRRLVAALVAPSAGSARARRGPTTAPPHGPRRARRRSRACASPTPTATGSSTCSSSPVGRSAGSPAARTGAWPRRRADAFTLPSDATFVWPGAAARAGADEPPVLLALGREADPAPAARASRPWSRRASRATSRGPTRRTPC